MTLAQSDNGWPASPDPQAIGIDPQFTVAGVTFPGGVKSGDVATVFADLLQRWHAQVEPLRAGWCWSYDWRPIRGRDRTLSNHASGTAVDVNAPLHPLGVAGTYSDQQRATIHLLLARYGGMVAWGGDYVGRVDEMHLEIDASAHELAELAGDIRAEISVPPTHEETGMALTPEDLAAIAEAVWNYPTPRHAVWQDNTVTSMDNRPAVDTIAGAENNTAQLRRQ